MSTQKRLTIAELEQAIIDRLAADIVVTKKDAKLIVTALFDVIQHQVDQGNIVPIPKFGTFDLQTLTARTGRNPSTGEPIELPTRTKVRFKSKVTK